MSRLLSIVAAASILLLALPLLQAADIARPAPEFVIRLADDSQILLSQFRGKVVAMEFLLTTCPHCKNTSRLMNKLQADYGPRGFQSLGVAIDTMPKLSLAGFIQETGAVYPVGSSEYNTAVEFLQHPAIMRLLVPQIMIIDRKGVIRAHRGGQDDEFFKDEEKVLRSILEPLLKERAIGGKTSTGVRKATPKKKAS